MRKAAIIFSVLLLFSNYSCHEEQELSLKIMSYNIRHGEGMDGVLDLSRAASIINSQSPHLCGLQEVDHFCTRTDSINQTEHLALSTNLTGTFGKFMNYQGGEYGMATLTASPLISTTVLQLPDGRDEPRACIVHEVKIDEGCVIAFANVHFDWINGDEGSRNRMQQAQALIGYLDGLDRTTIIIGDFNCTPDSPTMEYIKTQGFTLINKGTDNLSFQGDSKSEIDHIVFRNNGNVKIIAKLIQLIDAPIASDHRPLVAEVVVTY